MIEKWKLIKVCFVNGKTYKIGDKCYISNKGRCRINDDIVEPTQLKTGYLYFKGLLHRLVYESFIDTIPKGYEIDHIDGDKNNNCIDNLRAVTHLDNCHNPITMIKNKGWSNMGKEKMDAQHKYLSSLRKGSKLVIGEDGKRHWKYN